jgi:hypothetical protein
MDSIKAHELVDNGPPQHNHPPGSINNDCPACCPKTS